MLAISPERKRKFRADLAPLIDVVFLLLIFFMLTFATPGQGLDVSLPNGGGEVSDKLPLEIEIDAQGAIFLGGESVPLERLTERLEDAFQERGDTALSIRASGKTSYDRFAGVFDRARLAGATDFAIVM
ncbi:MAG: biopolymer transporter ExbD [Candidatus Nitrohelix vancouverensis]|uniref:Biopolymer transporter ExbD n=1 Tax=Candidatus Nitrohelix vancouverensis TaxID=2705534 RepID=A0A7T0G265_9BACT|nr:MAG: biopolymer transporter ExbD [Candidatus Nitrohelix vancouverensis]